MKKVFFLSALVAAAFCSCGNSASNDSATATDSTSVEVADKSAAKPIKGYESSEAFGVKAYIEKGVAKWKLVDQDAWVKLSNNPDFVRVEVNDVYDVEMPEAAIGVKILQFDDLNAILGIISESGHVYTLQLNEAIATVVLNAGKLPYGENVTGLKSVKEGGKYVVSTEQSDGGSVDIQLYGYNGPDGPRDCGITVGEDEYVLSMQSSWACTLRDGEGKTYAGSFVVVGDEAPNKYQLTFNETVDYTEDGNHHNAIDPIILTIDWNDSAETIKFSENKLGLPSDKPVSVEIWPLYE